MTEDELKKIADAARTTTADTADYKEPDVVVDIDSFRDFSEQD